LIHLTPVSVPYIWKELYENHQNILNLRGLMANGTPVHMHLKGLTGSSASAFAASVIKKDEFSHLFILNDREEAAYFFNDLENFCPEREIFFFPSSFRRSVCEGQTDPAGMISRTGFIDRLSGNTYPLVVVTYPEAFAEKVMPASEVDRLKLKLKKGESVSRDFMVELLKEYHFSEKDFVYEPGDFAIRGSIVDVFSFSCDRPYRIDFFGNDVESIRIFDVETQLSEQQLESVSIIPNLHDPGIDHEDGETNGRTFIISLMAPQTAVWTRDLQFILSRSDEIYNECRAGGTKGIALPGTGREIEEVTGHFPVLEFGQSSFLKTRPSWNSIPHPSLPSTRTSGFLPKSFQPAKSKATQTTYFLRVRSSLNV
jgi:transcription-repair coupling factor (superfamily II helicase)